MELVYSIVEFTADNSVAVILNNWLLNGDCCWLPVSKNKALEKLVKEQCEPAMDWSKHSVRVLHKYGM